MSEAQEDIRYRLLSDPADLARAAELFAARYPPSPDMGRNPEGGMVLGALDRDVLVGATSGHHAPDDAVPPRVEPARLRVTRLAVAESASGRNIGGGLMRLHRLLALKQGLRLATWEQELMDGRLAHLAIHKLGAVSRGFQSAPDGVLDMEWWVGSPRVKTRLIGTRPELDLAHALEAGAAKLNSARLEDDGLLHPVGGGGQPESASALVEAPHDVQVMRSRDPRLVLEWRAHLERILTGAFAQGYWLTDYLWLRGERVPRAYYLLIDGERTLG